MARMPHYLTRVRGEPHERPPAPAPPWHREAHGQLKLGHKKGSTVIQLEPGHPLIPLFFQLQLSSFPHSFKAEQFTSALFMHEPYADKNGDRSGPLLCPFGPHVLKEELVHG